MLIKKQVDNLIDWTIIIIGCLTLFTLFHHALFAHPVGDDYKYAYWVNTVSEELSHPFLVPFKMAWGDYFNWGARIISTFILSGYFLIYKFPEQYFIFPCLIIAIIFSIYLGFFSFLGRKGIKLYRDSFLSLIFYTAIFDNPPEVFYYCASIVNYQLGSIFYTISLMLLINLLSSKNSSNISFNLYIIFTCLSIFAASGSSETLLIVNFLTVLAFWIYTKLTKHSAHSTINIIFYITTIWTILLLLAPGIRVRDETQFVSPREHDFLWSSLESIKTSFHTVIPLIFGLPLLMLIIEPTFFIDAQKNLVVRGNLFNQSRLLKIKPFIFMAIYISFCFVVVFPVFYSLGIFPYDRVLSIFYFFFTITWLIYLRNLSLPFSINIKHFYSRGFSSIRLSLFIIVLVFLSKSMWINYFTDFQLINQYNDQVLNRYSMIEKATEKGEKNLVVPKLTNLPRTLIGGDTIQSDPDDWQNYFISYYYGLESIRSEHTH